MNIDLITHLDVLAAGTRIRSHVRRTPLLEVSGLAIPDGAAVFLKLEQLQYSGSFKVRGVFNRLLSVPPEKRWPKSGVVAATGGNAGLALAYAGAQLDVPVCVYVPETTPSIKVSRLIQLGADVVEVGRSYADAYEAALEYAKCSEALFCHAYDQAEVCAGQGTLGLEILEQTGGRLDTVILAVGGGGLMAGVATAVAPHVRVIGVEPVTIPTFNAALRCERPIDVDVSGVALDSLGATRLGDIAYGVARRESVISVLVSEDEIVAARTELWRGYRLAVEYGAATAFAALTSGSYQLAEGERAVVVVCGANVDLAELSESAGWH
jgi:threonine dehydratase